MVEYLQRFFKYILLNESYNFEKKSEILSRMRGFFYLKKKGKLRNILDLKKELTLTKIKSLESEKKSILNFFFGKDFKNPELLLRQYLLMRFGYFNFNRSIFYNLGKKKNFAHPIPYDWISLINKYDLNVNKILSLFWFYINVFFNFFSAVIFFIKFLFKCFFSRKKNFLNNYSFFYNILSQNCLPSKENEQKYTLLHWYINLQDIEKFDIKNIFHNKNFKKCDYKNISIVKSNHIFPPLNFICLINFFFISLMHVFFSFFLIFTNRWFYALLLKDIIMNNYVKRIESKLMAKQYLFDNSNFVYRPLWTYSAEKKGSEIVCYFYSTNCMEIERSQKNSSIGWGYRAMDWQKYYVWNDYQKKFVNEISDGEKKIIECGPIYFLDNKFNYFKNDNKFITVFDIHPRRISVMCSRVEPMYYYNDKNIIKFLQDIVETANKYNFKILLKQKRLYNFVVSKKYIKFIEKITKNNNIQLINPSVSPVKLIEKSDASISIPFTSSSLYALPLNKKTAYYDPISIINKDNIAAHGLDVICGIEELNLWFDNL